ncbi:MAG: four helix bundle protein [Paludibacteraceae bacterium]|nr:four helix bundle protein [Paludibacteraceae bacterium]MCQ2369994.1 four helix bundle protein [Paludibacteraceae bacterium]
MNKNQIKIQEKCIDFAVRIINLKKFLNKSKKEFNISDQIQRSGTSIGALYSEAVYAESESDLIHKLGISQKEANETLYWLKILYKSEYITQEQYDSLAKDADEIMKIITSIIIKLKNKRTT